MVMLIWMFMGELTLITAAGLGLGFFWQKLPAQMPWFYSLPWGEDQLIPKLWHGIGLAILALICVLNYLVARKLDKSDRVVALVVESAGLVLVCLYLASFFRVISIML